MTYMLTSRIPLFYRNARKRFHAINKIISYLVYGTFDEKPEKTIDYFKRFMMPAGMYYEVTEEQKKTLEPLFAEAEIPYQFNSTEKYQWLKMLPCNSWQLKYNFPAKIDIS